MVRPNSRANTSPGATPGALGLLLGRHLSMPAFSRSPADRAIRGLERRLEGALAKHLGMYRRMKGFGAVAIEDGSLYGALYLRAWREPLADGSLAEVGAYYRFTDSMSASDGLEPATVYWTLQISPEITECSTEPGYGWYQSAAQAASALHLAAGRGDIDSAKIIGNATDNGG